MKALVLEDVARFEVRDVTAPSAGPHDVLIRIGSVGICGTDLHIFHGLANYHRDKNGRQVPLKESPQILGHEFYGTVESVGKDVIKCKPGDKVIADQVLNCHSKARVPLCEYCETGDSHQCAYLEELGITGPPGAFSDLVSIPETNVVVTPADISVTMGAVIEPFACVLHASDRMERSKLRYEFGGRHPIRQVLITGAGPSGLFFIQYLRNVRKFDGQIFVADMRASRLAMAKKLGGTPLDLRACDVVAEIDKSTKGEMIHYWIEASGAGPVFDFIPRLMRHQGTFLYYGSGHAGRDVGCMVPFQFMEVNMVTSCGASGGFEADGTPAVYRRSMECLRQKLVDSESLLTHQYAQLPELQKAFSVDATSEEFIKGAWIRNSAS
jgi:threonine dehydrogenase-like Zn-dependent dehydrogenase